MSDSAANQERLISLSDVMQRLGVGRSTIYDLVKQGRLSKPVKPSPRRSCWPESEINAYIGSKIAERDCAEGD